MQSMVYAVISYDKDIYWENITGNAIISSI